MTTVRCWASLRSPQPTQAMSRTEAMSQARVIDALDMPLELLGPEIDGAQVAGRVAFGLVVEMWRIRMAALATGSDRARTNLVAELDHRDEAVAAGTVVALRSRPTVRAERGERAPAR